MVHKPTINYFIFQTFIDWKCHTKKKARDLQKDKQKTEGGSFITKGLTPTEEKLISFLTCISEEGADVDEVGLGNETVDVEFQTAHVFAEMPINQQSSKRPHSPPVVERKRLCTDSETPRTEEKTGWFFFPRYKSLKLLYSELD